MPITSAPLSGTKIAAIFAAGSVAAQAAIDTSADVVLTAGHAQNAALYAYVGYTRLATIQVENMVQILSLKYGW